MLRPVSDAQSLLARPARDVRVFFRVPAWNGGQEGTVALVIQGPHLRRWFQPLTPRRPYAAHYDFQLRRD